MSILSFHWPKIKEKQGLPILPVFLPFAGCKTRCLYCSQEIQTGMSSSSLSLYLENAEKMLLQRTKASLPACELAFYGGTFTGLDEESFSRCLCKASEWKKTGKIAQWRCSTRPDMLSITQLQRMKEAGCHCVELGIQSFDAEVLQKSLRNYSPTCAKEAIQLVQEQGLRCGVQLLPGLPASRPEDFSEDVQQACRLGASFLRFYPCLVFPETGLALLLKQGKFQPWSMEDTLTSLAQGILIAMQYKVAIIRIGVADEPGLAEKILAGPWDPELGSRALARALLLRLKSHIPLGEQVQELFAPQYTKGYFFGHKKENASALHRLGITPPKIHWTEEEEIRLVLEAKPSSFFTHTRCEHFPCHTGVDPENFNCLFCFCPLYLLGKDCHGNFVMKENGIKDCSKCSFPHIRENYATILQRYPEIKSILAGLAKHV